MKLKTFVAVLSAVISLACLVGWTNQRRASSKAVWEHKILEVYPGTGNITPGVSKTERILNQLGAEGWELVQVEPGQYVGTGVYYLKRAR